MLPVFPVTDGRRVHTQQFGEPLLRQPSSSATSLQPVAKGLRRFIRNITQEVDDQRHMPDIRFGTVRFPVANGGLVHADSVGNLPLEESVIEPFSPDMIA